MRIVGGVPTRFSDYRLSKTVRRRFNGKGQRMRGTCSGARWSRWCRAGVEDG